MQQFLDLLIEVWFNILDRLIPQPVQELDLEQFEIAPDKDPQVILSPYQEQGSHYNPIMGAAVVDLSQVEEISTELDLAYEVVLGIIVAHELGHHYGDHQEEDDETLMEHGAWEWAYQFYEGTPEEGTFLSLWRLAKATW